MKTLSTLAQQSMVSLWRICLITILMLSFSLISLAEMTPYGGITATDLPATVQAGTSHSITVTVLKTDGSVNTAFTGTITWNISDPLGNVPGSSTLTNGVGTFTVGFKTAGSQWVRPMYAVPMSGGGNLLISEVKNTTVAAIEATQLRMVGTPPSVMAGTSNNFKVTPLDIYGNHATSYRGTVAFSSTDPDAQLPAPYTFTQSYSGGHEFAVTFHSTGTRDLMVRPTAAGMTGVAQLGIKVNSGPATHFTLSGFPEIWTAGETHNITVTARDANGYVANGYTGTVRVSSTWGWAGDSTISPAAPLTEGVGTFAVTLYQTTRLTATDTVNAGMSVETGWIFVQSGPAAQIQVSAHPLRAGDVGNLDLYVTDAYGNWVDYTGVARLTCSDPAVDMGGDIEIKNGQGSRQVTFYKSGSHTVTPAIPADPTITGVVATIFVDPADFAIFVLSDMPETITAGEPCTVKITGCDVYGNIAFSGSILRFTSTDPAAELPTEDVWIMEETTVSVTFKTAGEHTLTATDTFDPAKTGSLSGIQVAPAAASRLAVTDYPNPTLVGESHPVTVTAYDAYDNVASGYTGTVHLSCTDAAAVLAEDAPLNDGIGTLAVTLNTIGEQALTATDIAVPAITGTQSGITVNPQPLTNVTLEVSPGGTALAGTPVTLIATPTGGGALEYRFRAGYKYPDGIWRFTDLSSPLYQTSNTCTWTPQEARTYTLIVLVREQGSVAYQITHTIGCQVRGPLQSVALQPSTPSGYVNQLVTLTASVVDGIAPEYRFRAGSANSEGIWNWVELSTPLYQTGSRCTWRPPSAGPWTLAVLVREQGSADAWQVMCTREYSIDAQPTGVTLQVSATSGRVGQPMMLTATAVGAVAEYRFRAGYKDAEGRWCWTELLSPMYQTSGTYTWTPPEAHTYILTVYVRAQGSTIMSQVSASRTVYVTE